MSVSFLKKSIKNPWHIFYCLGIKGLLNYIPDKIYLKIMYRELLEKKLDLKNPRTFNEKIQWLKLYDRKNIYVNMVDKLVAKNYVKNISEEINIIPTLGVWKCFDEIDFDTLPDSFVLKCTHDSGGIAICKNKREFNINEAKNKINKNIKKNFFYYGREWPYKMVKPQIIAEEYLEDRSTRDLKDYKFFCFNGEVKCFKIDINRFLNHRANYYDVRGNLLPFGEESLPPDYEANIQMPKNLSKMIELAEKISEDIPFLRVDFYEVNGKIFFGELTFYPASGFGKFTNELWDKKLGEWLILPEKY